MGIPPMLIMVDWRSYNASSFIPKNLSHEEYFPRNYMQSLLYEALQLCETSNAYNHYFEQDKTIKFPDQLEDVKINTLKNKPAKFIDRSRSELIQSLDLAVGGWRPRPKLYKRNVTMEERWKSLDETVSNGQHITHQLQEYKSITPTSSSCLSQSNTVFCDDYKQMTDIGEMSDMDIPSTKGSCSDGDCDSTFTQSDLSSISTMANDLERVTLDFPAVSSDTGGENESGNSSAETETKGKENKESLKQVITQGITELIAKSLSVPVGTDYDYAKGDFYEDREFDFLKTENVKRSTSLKTYKTPPGTPSRKKAVRFADALGLDLEDVRHVLNLDDPPNVPASAMKDLKVGLEEAHKSEGTRYLSACFPQPGASPSFIQRVRDTKVVLENCIISDKDLTVIGTVRVANIAYHKEVNVRFSVNDWTTFTDIPASYVLNSNDGVTDRFSFTINVPTHFQVGSKLQFAIQFQAESQEFWDSNNGRNYVIECYARAVPVSEADNTWLHFM